MDKLDLVSTDDLLNALFSRFDGAVFMAVQSKTSPNKDIYHRRWAGGSATSLGLCDLLHDTIQNEFKKENVDK